MSRRFGFASALTMGAALLATGAMAQSVAQPSWTNSDLAAWNGTPQTLVRMIRDIRQTEGGRILEIRYTDKDGIPGFRAAIARNGQVDFIRVGAQGGDAVELSQVDVPDWMLRWKARADIRMDGRAHVSLAQAVQTAEEASGGAPAIAAGIAPSASNPESDVQAYNVLVLHNGVVSRFAIDDRSGQIIADPRVLSY
jgi:hypothetical protein